MKNVIDDKRRFDKAIRTIYYRDFFLFFPNRLVDYKILIAHEKEVNFGRKVKRQRFVRLAKLLNHLQIRVVHYQRVELVAFVLVQEKHIIAIQF